MALKDERVPFYWLQLLAGKQLRKKAAAGRKTPYHVTQLPNVSSLKDERVPKRLKS